MVFKFGETKLICDKPGDIPVKVKVLNEEGKAGVHYTQKPTYIVHGKVPYLLGLNTLESWKAKLDMKNKKGLEVKNDDGTKIMKILSQKEGNHMMIGLQSRKKKFLQ